MKTENYLKDKRLDGGCLSLSRTSGGKLESL